MRRTTTRILLPLLSSLVLAGSAAPLALADGGPGAARAEARGDMEIGDWLYESGAFADAREVYVRAHERDPDHRLLFRIAETHRREGAFRQAALYYQRYLDAAPRNAHNRPSAQAHLRDLRQALFQRDIRSGVADSADTNSTREAAADHRQPWRRAFWVSITATGAAVVATTVSGLRMKHAEDEKIEAMVRLRDEQGVQLDSDDACRDAASLGALAADVTSVCSDGRRWARAATAFQLAALVGAAASGYLYYRGYVARPEREGWQVTPTASPGGAGVTAQLRF